MRLKCDKPAGGGQALLPARYSGRPGQASMPALIRRAKNASELLIPECRASTSAGDRESASRSRASLHPICPVPAR